MALTQVKALGLAADSIDETKLADDSIDSEHYNDGSIDTAHLADDAVTLAKMASGTDGQIITYDASGNPTAVGPGTDGQVLTSTGSGSPPAFETLPTSGAALTGSTNNEVVTVTGSNAMTGESGLTFDGTHLSITDGDLVIATAGHGIDFSANTQSAVSGVSMASELLDWYEEGTFTPTVLDWGSQTAGNSTDGSENGGKYTRIGNTVFINLVAHAVGNSSSYSNRAAFYIGGLPFTQDTSTFGTSFHIAMDGVTTDSGHGSVHAIQQSSSQQFRVMSSDYDAPLASFGPNLPNATFYVYATFHYRVA